MGWDDIQNSRLLRDEQWHAAVDGVYSRSPSPRWTALAWAGVLVVDDEPTLAISFWSNSTVVWDMEEPASGKIPRGTTDMQ